LPQKFEVKL